MYTIYLVWNRTSRIALDPERVGDEWGMMLKVERGLIFQNAVLIGVENF